MVAHVYNPNTQEIEAGRLQVPGQPELHGETLSQNKKKRNNNTTKVSFLC
jgi:hypothetical protein